MKKKELIQYLAKKERLWLKEKLLQVRNVRDWAKRSGCSRQRLHHLMTTCYEKTPNQILADERYKKIRLVIQTNPEATAEDVAGRVAPHWNQNRLCNFLQKYYSITFTQLRVEMLKKRV